MTGIKKINLISAVLVSLSLCGGCTLEKAGNSSQDQTVQEDNKTEQVKAEKAEKEEINEIHLRDKDSLYENDDDTSVVTMYLTVSKGNSSENTYHTWKEINSYSVYADTVGEALNELGISSDDRLKTNYELTDSIKDGMVITLQSAKSVTLTVDNTSTKYAVYQGTVQDLLTLAGISLGADDYTEPSVNTELKDNMAVTVYRIAYKTVDKKENISFKTRKQNDSSMDIGTEKVLTKGVNGVDEVSYKVKYVNGKEDSKTELSRKTVKEPVNQVVNVGTKAKSTGISDTITLQYSERYNVSSNPLTSFKGVVYYNGHRETYYSQRVLPGNGLNIPGRHVADDGTIRDGDGYICVAANSAYMKKGTTLMTSLGPAKVYDCGCAYGTIDIYVNW